MPRGTADQDRLRPAEVHDEPNAEGQTKDRTAEGAENARPRGTPTRESGDRAGEKEGEGPGAGPPST